jgi:O-antigen/teichoic acid export membrane protein
MYSYVAMQIVITLFIYFTANQLVGGIYPSINYPLLKKILKFSIPLGLATIVGTISIELDKLMIGFFYDTETMAIYANASREIPVTIISSSITAVLMPHLVRMLHENKKDDAVLLWKDATSLSYTFICFFASALFVFAPEVITLLYSVKYLPGVPVFRIYNIVLLLRCTYFGMILNSLGKTKFIFYSSVASLVLNLALNYVFYLMFGLIGPAIATLVSIFAVNFFQLIATSRNLKIIFRKIFPWKILFKITIINALLGICVYFIKLNFHIEKITGEILESIIIGSLWTLIYGIIMSKSIQNFWMRLR